MSPLRIPNPILSTCDLHAFQVTSIVFDILFAVFLAGFFLSVAKMLRRKWDVK